MNSIDIANYPRLPAPVHEGGPGVKLNIRYKDCILPETYLNVAESIENFAVREDDVWIVSQAKAGTTWTQEMIWCIVNDLDFEGAKEMLHNRFPYLEHCMFLAHNKPDSKDELQQHLFNSLQYANDLSSPRFIKSHLPWQLLPKQIQNGAVKPKIIYVARNAKDSCVSRFHHKRRAGFEGSFEKFAQLFLGGEYLFYAPCWPHVVKFWKLRNQPNILFLKYEDMKEDLPSVIKQTATFLGKSLSEEQTATLAQHLSFESMQKNETINPKDLDFVFGKAKHEGDNFQFVRKGVVGGWKEMMNKELSEQFDDWTEKNLRDTGLTFRQE